MKENIFIKVQILVLILGSFHLSLAKVSDERLCADPECNSKYIFVQNNILEVLEIA